MLKQIIEKKERKVEYIELIYDLIFVYMVGRNNALLHNVTGGFVEKKLFFSYIFCTLAVIQVWNYTTYYINVYGKKSVREHLFLFVNMFLLYFMAEGTGERWADYYVQYHVAWALILINIGVQYLCEYFGHKTDLVHKKRAGRMMFILFSESAIVLLSIVVFKCTSFAFVSPLAVLFGIVMVFAASKNACSAVVDFGHLSERAMLYVVFTFGEMIIAMASYFEGSFSFNSLYFSALGFLIVVGLFLSYGVFYDYILDREKQTNGLGYMLLHIFIIFALNNITTSLEFMRDEKVNILPKMVLLVSSFLMFFVFLFACGVYAKKRAKPKKKTVLMFLLICALFACSMVVFRENMYVNIAVSVVFTFLFFAFIYDYKKRFHLNEENN